MQNVKIRQTNVCIHLKTVDCMNLRPFQLLSVFRITSASQNLSVSQENKKKRSEKKSWFNANYIVCFTVKHTMSLFVKVNGIKDMCSSCIKQFVMRQIKINSVLSPIFSSLYAWTWYPGKKRKYHFFSFCKISPKPISQGNAKHR